ncbi:MAG: four helix bundle protein [Nitrospirota bacterium]
MKTHKDLDVWNKAMDLAEKVYTLTMNFPQKEQYGIVSQIRRYT